MDEINGPGSKYLRIAYLDQNKWIELARAAKRPDDDARLQSLLKRIRESVETGRLALPLTSANIYETHKINNLERRHDLAFVQAVLSRGLVIRGRHRRLAAELGTVLADCCQLAPLAHGEHWFLSNAFFEGFAEWNDERLGVRISEKIVNFIRENPAESLYEYLVETPEDVRMAAVRNFSDGSERLRSLVEDRRSKHASETVSMRRRIYSALLMIDEVERIIRFANAMGISWRGVQDIGPANVRRIIGEVPTYYIEREIALRLEAQSRPIQENDFRDMQSFCAVIPYADLVIGENQFVNLARQARLDKKFNTRLATDILALDELLDEPDEMP